ncbi:hypothetical protein TVAG_444480 [Trichomonas vaginalis G3]|uniref:Uncharacterized protein n=1 Tax=Trichomonas vaginalis (strain ATCC PRA-98 / G3) TaxID=412133 RepID=A2E2I9_TRIV3|nr:armadillo (ARM) repeat-containing protein family [Trichomonas vaginalis G3]EAY13164.1 hypothetical protein TVAG_444480 [Trichomonas vaginalis G3]KAI5528277.1 armadillo (ARM) repeat-containing protein family [Trichomonas vaginalis G3]|eukprot:XP_001325387.1 hypothetical protein [Trichomonas vaginalis G3]
MDNYKLGEQAQDQPIEKQLNGNKYDGNADRYQTALKNLAAITLDIKKGIDASALLENIKFYVFGHVPVEVLLENSVLETFAVALNYEFGNRATIIYFEMLRNIISHADSTQIIDFFNEENVPKIFELLRTREIHAKFLILEILINVLELNEVGQIIVPLFEENHFERIALELLESMPFEKLSTNKYEPQYIDSLLDLLQILFSYVDDENLIAFIHIFAFITEHLPISYYEILDCEQKNQPLPETPIFEPCFYSTICLVYKQGFRSQEMISNFDLPILIPRLVEMSSKLHYLGKNTKDILKYADSMWKTIVFAIDLSYLPESFFDYLATNLNSICLEYSGSKHLYKIIEYLLLERYELMKKYFVLDALIINFYGYSFKIHNRSINPLFTLMKNLYDPELAEILVQRSFTDLVVSKLEGYSDDTLTNMLIAIGEYCSNNPKFSESVSSNESFHEEVQKLIDSDSDSVSQAAENLINLVYPE